jgi:hypothetical protein
LQIKSWVKDNNIKLESCDELPIRRLVDSFALDEESFLKYKKYSNLDRALGISSERRFRAKTQLGGTKQSEKISSIPIKKHLKMRGSKPASDIAQGSHDGQLLLNSKVAPTQQSQVHFDYYGTDSI